MRRFFINNPRRIIFVSPFEDEHVVQGVSRREWLFLTGFVGEKLSRPELRNRSPDLSVICKCADVLPQGEPLVLLCRLLRRMFAGGQAVSGT